MTLHTPTLLLAAIMVRTAFVLIFVANAYNRRKQAYLLLWFASPAFALAALLVVASQRDVAATPTVAGAAIGALAGLSFSLCWAGLRALLKRPFYVRRVLLQGLAPGLAFGVIASEGAIHTAWVGMLGGLALLATFPVVDLIPVFRRARLSSQFFVLAGLAYYALAFGFAAGAIALGVSMGWRLEPMMLPLLAADPFFAVLLLVNFLAITGEQARLSLREQATHDKLTGLLNRRGFVEATDKALQHAAVRSTTHCVLMADIDHFKAINDRLGHDAGDMVLTEFGRRCRGLFQRPGDYAARWGGEEYAVYLHDTTADEAMVWAEKLRRVVAAEPFVVLGSRQTVTVSVGVAPLVAGEVSVAKGLSRADIALYEAKSDGRDCVRLAKLVASPPLQPANDQAPAGMLVG